ADERNDESRLGDDRDLAVKRLDRIAGEREPRAATRRRHSRVVDAPSLHLSLAVCDPRYLPARFAMCQGIFAIPAQIRQAWVPVSVSPQVRRPRAARIIGGWLR